MCWHVEYPPEDILLQTASDIRNLANLWQTSLKEKVVFCLWSTFYASVHYSISRMNRNTNCDFHFTFMLPCIVIDFFLNNKPDALIIPILFSYKTLHVSGIFSAHHKEFSTVHSTLVSFMQVSDDRFQAESGWNQCRMHSRKLLMMGREDARNM